MQLLTIWETGLTQSPIERMQTVLVTAFTDLTPQHIAALMVGECNDLLFTIYQNTFNNHIQGIARCPQCSGMIEFSFATEELLAADRPEAIENFIFNTTKSSYTCRLLTYADLVLAAQQPTLAQAEHLLISCCLPENATTALSAEEANQLAELLKKHDPHAELLLNLSCSSCSLPWETAFDIGAFLWDTLAAQARQLLAEIHCLARAYGWAEHHILSLSQTRRDYYLNQLIP
jgi:hypothetical protein